MHKTGTCVVLGSLLLAHQPLMCAEFSPTSPLDAVNAEATNQRRNLELLILGTQHMPTKTIRQALNDFRQHTFDESLSEAIRDRVKQVYEQAGIELVSIDPPFLSGNVIVVRIRELTLSSVRVEGLGQGAQESLLSKLPSLSVGSITSIQQLANELHVFNQHPRRKARVDFLPDGKGQLAAHIQVEELSPVYGSVFVDNSGTDASGRGRIGFNLNHSDLGGTGVQGQIGAISGLGDEKIIQSLAALAIPLGEDGKRLDLQVDYSESDLGQVQLFDRVAGLSQGIRVAYTQALIKTPLSDHSAVLSYSQRSYDDVYSFAGVNLGTEVSSESISLGVTGQIQDSGLTTYALSTTHNLEGEGKKSDAAYAMARLGADASWMRVNLELEHSTRVFEDHRLLLQASIQHTDEPLISGEQFRHGGKQRLAAVEDGELVGDRGVLLGVQYQWSAQQLGPLQLKPFAFVDAAHAARLNIPGAFPDSSRAISSGVGIYAQLGKSIGLDLSAARLMHQENLPQSKTGDVRIHGSARFDF